MVRLILITLLSSAFFSSTYILNELMSITGGHWFWSASLRFLFILIMLTIFITLQHGFKRILELSKIFYRYWLFWTITGSVGFGLFYAALCFASAFISGWIVAATFMFTVVASMIVLMAFGHQFAKKFIFYSVLIFIGVVLVNVSEGLKNSEDTSATTSIIQIILYGAIPCLVAAFSYPIGTQLVWQASYNSRQLNLKKAQANDEATFNTNFQIVTTEVPRPISLDVNNPNLAKKIAKHSIFKRWLSINEWTKQIPTIETTLLRNSFNKVWLMTLGSMPFWLLLGLFINPKLPDNSQVITTFIVALFSGIIATSIFLYAREQAQTPSEVAGVDATQASEIIFALLGGMILLHNPMPTFFGLIGIVIIIIGLILFAKNG